MPVIEPGLWLLPLVAVIACFGGGWVVFAKERKHLFVDTEVAWLVWHWYSGGPLDKSRSEGSSLVRRLGLAVLRTLPLVLVFGIPVTAGTTALVLVTARLSICAAINKWWIKPIAEAVRPFVAMDEDTSARKIVKFKRVQDHWGVGITVKVGKGFLRSNKENVIDAVEMRAGVDLGKVDHHWYTEGRQSCVKFVPALRIPERVTWTDRDGTPNGTVRELVEQTPSGTVWLGQGRDGVQVTYNLNRHPHVLISGPTGGGKSAVARSIAVQLMAQDPECEVINLDAKHLSQLWLRDLPGCRSLHNLPEISDTIVELGEEVRKRVAHADSLPRREVEPYVAMLSRKVLIVEEAPTLMAELDMWWRGEHGKVACPAVQDLRMMLNMSRVAGFNILGLAQRADANAMGGGLARENYVLRILVSGYTKRAWDMLVPEVEYVPSVERDGWAMVCHGAVGIETQCLYITDDEAEAWVAESRGLRDTSQTVPEMPGTPQHTAPPVQESRVQEPSVQDTHDDTQLITLRQAFTLGYIEAPSLSALQRAAGRAKKDGKFIEEAAPGSGPDGPRYWKEALVNWWDQRPRSAAKKKDYKPLVYFLNMNGGELRYGTAVKIGMSTNLPQRLDSFAMHPDQVIRTLTTDQWGKKLTEASMKELEAEHHERWENEVGDDGKSLRLYDDRELFRCEGALARYLGVDGP